MRIRPSGLYPSKCFPFPTSAPVLNKYDKLVADIDVDNGLWTELQTLLQRRKNCVSLIYVVRQHANVSCCLNEVAISEKNNFNRHYWQQNRKNSSVVWFQWMTRESGPLPCLSPLGCFRGEVVCRRTWVSVINRSWGAGWPIPAAHIVVLWHAAAASE